MNGWTTEGFQPIVKAHGIANLSGGGITSKFGMDLLFNLGFSADLRTLWSPPKVMRDCASDLNVSEKKCYSTWGCGNGAAIIVDESDVEVFISEAEKHGISALDAGPVSKTPAGCSPCIKLTSGFSGDRITLEPEE
jgi:phosphoribosylaminoimidazole (AIR) synthetase